MKKVFGTIVGIIIGLTGLFLSACDNVYDNISIKTSTQNISLAVGETKTFNIEIENYFTGMSAEVQLNNLDDLITIEDKEINGNKIIIEIKGQKVGSTTIEVKSFEGNKTCNINLEVYENVSSYELNETPYVLNEIGNSYILADQNYFVYSPSNAKEPNAVYTYNYLNENIEIKKINVVADEETGSKVVLETRSGDIITPAQNEFTLTISLEDYPNLPSQDFVVKIITPIELGELKLIKKGLLTTEYLTENDAEMISVGDTITLISNIFQNSYYEFEMPTNSEGVVFKFISENSECTPITISSGLYTATSDFSRFFSMQAKSLGVGPLVIKAYYSAFEEYVVQKEYTIYVTSAPSSINVNNKSIYNEVTLYDFNNTGENAFLMSINVLDRLSTFESVEFAIVEEMTTESEPINYSDILNVFYKDGYRTSTFEIPYTDFANNTIKNNILLTGKAIHDLFYIRIAINSSILEEYQIVYYVPIVVKEGATSLDIDEIYDGGITLNVSDAQYEFDGLTYESENAYIGDFTINYINNSSQYFSVEQINTNEKTLKITPLAVGVGGFQVVLPNGVSKTIFVRVEQEVEDATLSVVSSDSITKTETDENDNITKLYIAYTPPKTISDQLKIQLKMLKNPTYATLYSITSQVDNEEIATYNQSTQALTILGTGEATLTIELTLLEVVDFKTVQTETKLTYQVGITVYSPLSNIEFVQDGELINGLSVCRTRDVGYSYQNLATINFSLKATLKDGTILEDVFDYYGTNLDCNITIQTPSKFALSTSTINNFGSYSRNKNTFTLTCSDTAIEVNTSFWLAFMVNEYSQTTTRLITITIREFAPLKSIGFTNYQESIYLSGANTSYTFNTYMDANSDCQEFEVRFEPSKSEYTGVFTININSDYSQVLVSHNPANGTGSGTLYFIPKTSIIDANGNFLDPQTVFISYSDGTDKDNPELISTPEQFVSAMSSVDTLAKHYLITTTLDFTGIAVSGFGDLTGSITGANASARLINLNINSILTSGSINYVGLFRKIQTGAEINNLIIEGSININRTTIYANSANAHLIGLVAGENLGTIKNVSVIIDSAYVYLNDSNNTTSTVDILIGGYVGQNKGSILTVVDEEGISKNYTAITYKTAFSVNYNGYSSFTGVGGITGKNIGLIERTVAEGSILYNENINSAKVNLLTQGISSTGGIAGINQTLTAPNALIKGQIVSGTITTLRNSLPNDSYKGGENCGGVVGTNRAYIDDCIIRGTLKAYDYVGGIVGKDETVQNYASNPNPNDYLFITNCKVQAPKSSKNAPMIYAISSLGHCGAIAGNGTEELNTNIYANNDNTATYYYEIDIPNRLYPVVYSYMNNIYNLVKETSLFVYNSAAISVIGINESNGTQKLVAENIAYENKIANMFIYEAENLNEQGLIDSLNRNREIPFMFENSDTITLSSLSPNLSIDSNGNIELLYTGLATLQVFSLLDTTLTSYFVYINVVNAFNGFVIEIAENEAISDVSTIINVYENKTVSLQYRFTHSDVEALGEFGETVLVKLKDSPYPTVEYEYDKTITENEYTSITQTGNLLVISALATEEEISANTVLFKPKFELTLAYIGIVRISNEIIGENSELSKLLTETDKTVELTIEAKRGTEKIQLNISSLSAEPVDEIEIAVEQITDNTADYLKIVSINIEDEVDGPKDYFNVLSATGYEYDEINDRYTKIDASGSFVFQFNYEKYGNLDYEGTYYITLIADNGKEATVVVSLNKQSLSSILLKNYYNVSNTYNPILLESNYMASGADNLLVMEVFPYFADFDYILVSNDATNYDKNNIITLTICSLDENKKFVPIINNVVYGEDGVKIAKSVVETLSINSSFAKIYILYETISKATVDTTARINICAIKNTDVLLTTQQTVSVIIKDSVYFTIDNRELSTSYYVAKGVSYDLTLNLYGFTEDQMQVEIYNKNNQVADEVSIIKDADGYKLVVGENIDYVLGEEGYQIKVVTYGENSVDGLYYTSGKSELNLIIVDFVVLTDVIDSYFKSYGDIDEFDKYTVIKDTLNAVQNVAVGNKVNLDIEFLNGLTIEYNTNISSIAKKVLTFQNSLKNNGTWKVKTASNGILGQYTKQIIFDSTTSLSNQNLVLQGSLDTNGNKVLSVSPMKIVDYTNPIYYFNYAGKFLYVNGSPTYADVTNLDAFDLSTDFIFSVYPNSTEVNALPIYNYNQFMKMNKDAHYILMNNITLENDFKPISTEIASLDGNGYSIYYPSSITFEEGDNFGLFSVVSENTLLKNLTIKIITTTSVIINSENTVMFGILAGENDGTITNCSVIGNDFIQFSVSLPNQTTDLINNYVAGLVGNNKGFISNSRVSATLSAVANVAGFVGINENKIASSYVRDSMIINRSSFSSHKTAGFVVKNGLSVNSTATITTSYVCGTTNKNAVYSQSTTKCISSMPSTSGFVYTNFNEINNCYSDILINTSSTCAGFVYENAGTIINTYSTSTFGTTTGQDAYAFYKENVIGTSNNGVYQNCFFLFGNANQTAYKSETTGLMALNEIDFLSTTLFESYGVSSNITKTEAVWFFPASTNETSFKIDGMNLSFTSGKLELVAPNIITNSQKVLDVYNTKTDATTLETTYAYTETKDAIGSLLNPIIISSAQRFEAIILQNSQNNITSKYYRLVCDIDYQEEEIYNSNLYNTIFTGTFEGNGMEISGFSIDNRATTTNGGLFAKIGQGYSNLGVVKNLDLSPYYLNFPNTKNAGTLAGALEGGRIYNINCDGYSANMNGVKILGVNSVGGIIGIATNAFKMVNVESSVSANATYDHTKTDTNVGIYLSATDNGAVSYAGAIVGVTNGIGSIINAKVNDKTFVIAEIAGLLFGKIGKSVEAKNITQTLIIDQTITATVYGGIISGENSGKLTNTIINGDITANFFKNLETKRTLATAVGGAIGLMEDGTIDTVNCFVNLSWTEASPSIVGGLVGEMLGGTIKNSSYQGNITLKASTINYDVGYVVGGGIVGKMTALQTIETTQTLKPQNITIYRTITKGKIDATSVNISMLYIGGIVGQSINTYSSTETKTTTAYAYKLNGVSNKMNITVNSTIYGGIIQVYVGGFVGGAFSDNTQIYGGEIIVYDETNLLLDKYSSSSTSTIKLSVTDNKNTAEINLSYGGILGKGYPVRELSVVDGLPTKSSVWGLMLKNYDKALTAPVYSGQTAEVEGEVVPIAMIDSEFLTITSNMSFNKIENNYWEA